MDEIFIGIAKWIMDQDANMFMSNLSNITDIFNKPLELLINNANVNNVFDTISSIATVLMVIYFLIDLTDIAMREQFNLEVFVKNFAKLIIAYAIVLNIKSIIIGIDNLVQAIVTDANFANISTPTLGTTNSVRSYAARLNAGIPLTFGEALSLGINMIIHFCFNFFVQFAIVFVGIKRALYLGFYYVLSPMLVADAFSNGIVGAITKIKRILALYLQLPYVYLACHVVEGIRMSMSIGSITAGMSSFFVTMILLWTLVKSINNSQQEITRMFG